MNGRVTLHRIAVVRITVVGWTGEERDIDVIVDTGFTGYLTLPPSFRAEMGLPYRNDVVSTLAGGIELASPTHAATVRWTGEQRPVLVLALEMPPVLGMSLLHDQRLSMDVIDGGEVSITALK